MPSRSLHVISTPPGDAGFDTFAPALRRALDGSGPVAVLLDTTVQLPAKSTGRPQSGHTSSNASPLANETSPRTDLDGIAVIIATSGSTGQPKNVLLSAAALRASARATHARLGGPGRWLLALPPARVAGLQVVIRALDAGAEPTVVDGTFTADGFTAATAALTARATGSDRRYTSLVPTQLIRLLDAGPAAREALASYDAVLLGGASTPPSVLARAVAAGVKVVRTYGMTETCGGCVYNGRPLDDVRVRIGADGRIHLGGPVLFSGYLDQPELTRQSLVDGWLITSDLGNLEPSGELEVLGRIDDMIVSGGVKVPPLPVERALMSLPEVTEAVVVGVPDPEWGQRVVAYVVLRDDKPLPPIPEIRERLSGQLERAYIPKEFIAIPELPALPSGKPDRRGLAERYASAEDPHRHGSNSPTTNNGNPKAPAT